MVRTHQPGQSAFRSISLRPQTARSGARRDQRHSETASTTPKSCAFAPSSSAKRCAQKALKRVSHLNGIVPLTTTPLRRRTSIPFMQCW